MSNIANSILGAVQNQAPAKGKAGHGKVIGGASKGADFASTVASLSGREGDAGRKDGRLSISGRAEVKQTMAAEAKQAAGAEPKRTAFAESTQTAATGHADGTQVKAEHETRGIGEVLRKADPEASEKEGATFAERAAALLDAASRPGRNVQADKRMTDVRGSDEPASDDAEGTAAVKEDVAAETDVGNLLELLAAANASPQATANGTQVAAAAAGGVPQVRGEADAKSSDKANLRTDAAAAKADAALVPDAAADVVDLPRSDADQAFRLIRADGKGRELDMSISDKGDRATFRDASQTGPKGETVTVVDTRRYIGLAQTGNSAAVTTAIVQDPEWARSLGSTGGLTHAAAATGKVVNTLKIQMHPIELGLVTATLRLQGDELTVSLQVQTGEAYRQLTEDQDAIVKALRDQGFGVDQVSVQLSPADRSSGTQQGNGQNQQQFSSQPQAREGGNSRQGGGEQAARNFGREEMSHEGTMSENAPGLADGQSRRSGSVYL